MSRRPTVSRVGGDRGATTVMVIGFATILVLVIAVAVDSTAAYVQRQGLDTLADGAALHGADLAAEGEEVYTEGVPVEGSLEVAAERAREAVGAYLDQVGARGRYPGLVHDVSVEATTVTVRLSAPLDLPLDFPGAPAAPRVGSTGSAVVDPEE